jgi:2-hydroxychromene-2-carboxylate isomerase
MPVNLRLAFQRLGESASPRLNERLLGLCPVPITSGTQCGVPAKLKIVRGFGHGILLWLNGLENASLPAQPLQCREPAKMTEPQSITVYTDYKSPYAYLAKDLAYELPRDFPVRLDWRPYILDISSFLGSARVDASGTVLEEDRNAHQWRRVRYSYMDCRREARKRGLTIRGPQKIWDSTLAAAGMLFAQRAGDAVFRRYHDTVFERFWQRALDIEDAGAVAEVLSDSGADGSGFHAEAVALRAEVAAISRTAEADGVFGVPTFVVAGEIYWGREHLPDIRERLAAVG